MNEKNKIDFHGNKITVIEKDGIQYVAMKPIAEALGLDWTRQFRNLKEDSSLAPVIATMATTGSDGKSYEMICLPLNKINGWLFTVNPKQYSDWRRDRIKLYRDECFEVLYNHFHKPATAAVVPSAAPLVTLDDFKTAIARWEKAENAKTSKNYY